MKLKYYLRGLGVGIVVTCILMSISNKNAVADACTGSNPRQPSVEEMEQLLKCCYYDTEVDF